MCRRNIELSTVFSSIDFTKKIIYIFPLDIQGILEYNPGMLVKNNISSVNSQKQLDVVGLRFALKIDFFTGFKSLLLFQQKNKGSLPRITAGIQLVSADAWRELENRCHQCLPAVNFSIALYRCAKNSREGCPVKIKSVYINSRGAFAVALHSFYFLMDFEELRIAPALKMFSTCHFYLLGKCFALAGAVHFFYYLGGLLRMDESVKELNLLLLYRTGWSETRRNRRGEKVFMAWKGYDYEILNDLEREGLIRQADSMVFLTKEGIRRAEAIKRKLY